MSVEDIKLAIDNARNWHPPARRASSSVDGAPAIAIRVLSVNELLGRPRPSWRIRNLLPEKGLVVVYGSSGAGKTYVVVDMACAIALGKAWFGRRVKQGRVIYVAAEGTLGVRLAAYLRHHQLDAEHLDNLAIVEQSINLLAADGDLESLSDAIQAAANTRNWQSVDLIVVDTLNRAMPGGNENDSQDMGRMVTAAKTIEENFSCAVLYVHHAGKDESKGSRGHSSLKAATEGEISVKGSGDVTRVIHLEKLREGESGVDIGAFNLERVDLGATRDHDPEAGEDERDWSCVVVPCDVQESTTGRSGLKPKEILALQYLNQALDNHAALPPFEARQAAGRKRPKEGQTGCPLDAWRTTSLSAGGLSGSKDKRTQERTFRRYREKLETSGIIVVMDDWVWLADKADNPWTT